jgi:hypothetical protein
MTGQICDRYEVTKLQNAGTALDYKAEVGKLIQESPAQLSGEMESEWQKICHSVKDTAKEVLGYKTKRNHDGWYDEECKKALDIHNESELECYTEQQEHL